MAERTLRHLKIVNEKGLHARASAKLVEVVESFKADAFVRKDGLDATGDSIMGLLMLAASKGTTIEVETVGPDADGLANALEHLISDGFGEEL
ncbi:MAG: HPr family phosphocarrier protein [Pseudomonadota bacterium]